MEVFGLGLKIKEEGAATVEAAMKKLNAEMNRTSAVATNTGQKMEVSGKYAAKTAINIASLGAKFAEAGTISGSMATKIVSVASTVASMFGPAGIAVAALGGFAAAAITNGQKASDALAKTAEDFRAALQKMADAGDVIALTKELQNLERGTPFGRIEDDVINTNDGLLAMKARLKEIEPLFEIPGFTKTSDEVKRLRTEIQEAERRIKQLRAAILSPAVGQAPTTGPSPISVTARDPKAIQEAAKKEADAFAAAMKAFDEQYYKDSEKSFNQRFDFIEQEEKDFKTALDAMMAQHAADSAAAFAFQMDTQAAAVRDSIQYKLGGGILDGMRAGFQAALASGDIKNFTTALAQTLSGSLSQAITDYLMTGLASLWKKFGKTLIQGLADVMADFAAKSIVFAKMVEAIKKFLAFGNGVGALIAATALLAFAHANGGKAQMGTTTMAGGAGGLSTAISPSTLPTQQIIFGATSATTAAGMTPRQAMNVTIIGPNDPSAQRAIQELMTKANSRGSIG